MDITPAILCTERVLNDLLNSSSSSDDDEELMEIPGRNPKPRVKGFVENVIVLYSEKDVSLFLNIIFLIIIYLYYIF